MSELLKTVRGRLRPDAADASVEEISVGERAVLVELRVGGQETAGLAHLPPGPPPEPADRSVESLLSGVTAEVDGEAAPVTRTTARADRALGIAALNALSAPHIEWRRGDPMALLDDGVERITTVGLFTPAFRKFEDVAVRVIERERIDEAPDPAGVRVRTFTPGETAEAMTDAEVVFVTGSAFVYGGVETYLEAAPASATVVVIGATASFLPNPLFAAGVDVVAGAAVTDAAGVRAALGAGACGTDLHDAGLQKVYVARETTSGLQLGECSPDSRHDSSGGADTSTANHL
ncbi:Rossmann-like domain-containing protein [Halobellus rufus]|uniref:Rossmann-like domain-containing protein n=1 Tax=Halobellus rufus TaxID=1448860 RepID=UPI000679BFB4|nr:DUF364 domain-containing protein [Halobellus rufus]